MTMYQCKHCKHPVHDYTTKDINEWMHDAVVLFQDGTRLIGEFDTEHGHTVGKRETENDGVWLHKLCWETAGRPEFDSYETPSKRMDECAYGDEELWIITPTVTDEAERARLLATGIKAHEGRLFDQRASEMDNLIETDSEWQTDEHKQFPWRQMFQVHGRRDTVEIYNKLTRDCVPYDGTEDEADAECKRLFEAFLASDDYKALRDRRVELEAKWNVEHMEKLKKEGRFQVGYRPSKKGGDVLDGRRMGRSMFYVRDKLVYDEVAEFDFSEELAPKEYETDPDWEGEHASEAWLARVNAFRAETGRIRDEADAMAKSLNSDWADAGYPGKDWVAPV